MVTTDQGGPDNGMDPDIQAYTSVMEEIRRRTTLVSALFSNQVTVMYKATQVESMVLQVRMITELIALASLAANKEIFEENQRKFEKHWHPSKILKDVEGLNPSFYPKPILEVPSSTAGVKRDLVAVTTGFMARDELIEVHGRCGSALHAQNPYGKARDYGAYENMIPTWMERIMRLLNCHQIRLLDSERLYVVHMKEPQDDRVHMYTFERVRASRHDLWKICGSSEDVMSTGPCKPTIPMYPMSCGIG